MKISQLRYADVDEKCEHQKRYRYIHNLQIKWKWQKKHLLIIAVMRQTKKRSVYLNEKILNFSIRLMFKFSFYSYSMLQWLLQLNVHRFARVDPRIRFLVR